jgi:putative membrane protein
MSLSQWIDYEWIKAAHIIAVIAWMSGMLYLPRLMVYHCDAEKGSQQSETFKIMEYRLLHYITSPAMVFVWIFGLYMAIEAPWYDELWLQLKFALVVVMSALHGFLTARVRDFANDRNTYSQKFYRIINEVPAALIVLIVILVVIKPFR